MARSSDRSEAVRPHTKRMGIFYCRTKIISGSGAVTALKDLAPRRLMLVTDPYFAKNGTAQRIVAATGAQVEIFDRVAPDPSVELAAEGTAKVKEFDPDVVVALGGGSAGSQGTGGMATKLHAAEICLNAGCSMVITNGKPVCSAIGCAVCIARCKSLEYNLSIASDALEMSSLRKISLCV